MSSSSASGLLAAWQFGDLSFEARQPSHVRGSCILCGAHCTRNIIFIITQWPGRKGCGACKVVQLAEVSGHRTRARPSPPLPMPKPIGCTSGDIGARRRERPREFGLRVPHTRQETKWKSKRQSDETRDDWSQVERYPHDRMPEAE